MKYERRYEIKCFDKTFLADEADMRKLEENAHEMLVRIKQGIIHPSSISYIDILFVPYVEKFEMILEGGVARKISKGLQPPDPIQNKLDDRLLE